jgi:tRNA A37 threonylcarbamoyltransferase TsaD
MVRCHTVRPLVDRAIEWAKAAVESQGSPCLYRLGVHSHRVHTLSTSESKMLTGGAKLQGLVVAGGVASNAAVRAALSGIASQHGLMVRRNESSSMSFL